MRDHVRQHGWKIVEEVEDVEVEDIGSSVTVLDKREELLAAREAAGH
jgi:hypothetical protein